MVLITWSFHWHGESDEQVCEPDVAIVSRIKDSENIFNKQIRHSTRKDHLDQIMKLLSVDSSIGKLFLESCPELYNLVLSEAGVLSVEEIF